MSKNRINVYLLNHTVSAVGLFKWGGIFGGEEGTIAAKRKRQRKAGKDKNARNLAGVQMRQKEQVYLHLTERSSNSLFHTSLFSSSLLFRKEYF